MRLSVHSGVLWCLLLLGIFTAVNWRLRNFNITGPWGGTAIDSHKCPNQRYEIHIFIKGLLIIYISSFLTVSEINDLSNLRYSIAAVLVKMFLLHISVIQNTKVLGYCYKTVQQRFPNSLEHDTPYLHDELA